MTARFPDLIRVAFDEYGGHVPYAAELAEQLRVPLKVYLPIPRNHSPIAERLLTSSSNELLGEMSRRVEGAVRKYFARPENANILTAITPLRENSTSQNNILVSCDTLGHRGAHVLSPGGERKVFRTDRGPIFVPLGDGAGSLFATEHAVLLAQQLNTEVIFWHTTWRNEKEKSADPQKHVCPEAREVIALAEQCAWESGVRFRSCHIECADTVVEGIIRTALCSGASLIVMARGKRKKFGAYSDRVRDRNCPVPLLILAQPPVVAPELLTLGQGEA